jgi:hypothetical protein
VTLTPTDESHQVIYETQDDHNNSEAHPLVKVKIVHTATLLGDVAIYHEIREDKYTIRSLATSFDVNMRCPEAYMTVNTDLQHTILPATI